MTEERVSYAPEQGKINLALNSWYYNCPDGCCTDFGDTLYCNGIEVFLDFEYIGLGHLGETLKEVLKQVELVNKEKQSIKKSVAQYFWEFNHKDTLNEFLDNFIPNEELRSSKELWDSFKPHAEILILSLHCEEMSDVGDQDFIIINDCLLSVVGDDTDSMYDTLEKLKQVLTIMGFEVEVEVTDN